MIYIVWIVFLFMNKVLDGFRKFWRFLHKDSWASFAVTLILAFLIIKFIFFPGLSLLTGTSLPLVIVESCSMYHSNGLEEILENPIYRNFGIGIEDTFDWDFRRGFSKGDVIFVVGVSEPQIGDVIIFRPNPESLSPHPIIHRVVSTNPLQTKGDNNVEQLKINNNVFRTDETKIDQDQVIGKALFRIPFIGWAKLIFFEAGRAPLDRGLCR
jgi:hypothetical protein